MPEQDILLQQLVVAGPVGLLVLAAFYVSGALSPQAFSGAPKRAVGLGLMDIPLAIAAGVAGLMVASVLIWLMGMAPPATKPGVEPPPMPVRQLFTIQLVTQFVAGSAAVIYFILRVRQTPNGLGKVGLIPRRPIQETGVAAISLVAALPLVIAVNITMVNIAFSFGVPPPEIGHKLLKTLMETDDQLAMALMIISAVLLAPVLEELLFRGLLQTALLNYFETNARWVIIIIASILFTIVHGAVPWQMLPSLFVLGMIMGWVYERTGSLLPCVLLHMGFNAVNTAMALSLRGDDAATAAWWL